MRICALLFFIFLLGSCKSLFVDKQELAAFKVLKRLDYPHQEMVNKYVTESLQDVLTEKEILILEKFGGSAPLLENFIQTECVGCSNSIGRTKPLYGLKKGKFIHFGLQNEIGVENWVFKKNGAFATRFHSFQGASKEEIEEALKDIQNIDYVLEGVYPVYIDEQNVYLEHIQFENPQAYHNKWYQPMFPTKIGYSIDLAEKQPELRFRMEGGLHSYQRPDENGEPQIINFVEPLMYANVVGIDEPLSYSSVTDAFYANATFFLMDLEEEAEVSIHIESRIAGKDFKFSVLENDGFYTMKEYLDKKETYLDRYQNTMDKGNYLIRVLHENADYAEKPLYTVYINKNAKD